VSADELACARQFLEVLAEAARTGDRGAIYPLLAPDVEWLTPKRDVRGIDEARDELGWIRPPDHLDVEFGEPELTHLGDGRVVCDVHETYHLKETGDYAYARDRRIELTLREGKVARYEMRLVG
jgi:ketosteroid isomerase-like protein